MTQESVVYGCIKDVIYTSDMEQTRQRRHANRQVLAALPSVEDWPLIGREMFVLPSTTLVVDDLHTEVVPFGNSYKGVEYEWEQWLQRFEDLLQNMFWVSATVHLETEFNGTHTFTWHTDKEFHAPNSGPLSMRCEWTHEAGTL
ncbi:MAG TPA: hypothetical protein VFM32_10540 [Spongiibacteraceae bacterium]|nr:hypothetical protein [Spongiibacteraceae bacterium]